MAAVGYRVTVQRILADAKTAPPTGFAYHVIRASPAVAGCTRRHVTALKRKSVHDLAGRLFLHVHLSQSDQLCLYTSICHLFAIVICIVDTCLTKYLKWILGTFKSVINIHHFYIYQSQNNLQYLVFKTRLVLDIVV